MEVMKAKGDRFGSSLKDKSRSSYDTLLEMKSRSLYPVLMMLCLGLSNCSRNEIIVEFDGKLVREGKVVACKIQEKDRMKFQRLIDEAWFNNASASAISYAIFGKELLEECDYKVVDFQCHEGFAKGHLSNGTWVIFLSSDLEYNACLVTVDNKGMRVDLGVHKRLLTKP